MSDKIAVLIVEDDEAQHLALADALAAEGGFAVTVATTIAEAKDRLGALGARWDVVLLDIGLPDGEGWDLCTWMRDANVRTPTIIITGRANDADIIRGLEAGASDWVCKPVRAAVLAARIRAQHRLFAETDHAVFAVGQHDFFPSKRMLIDRTTGRRVRLTDKECGVVKRLLRARGTPVDKNTLLCDVWGYSAGVSSHTLETHIYRLRQKIERKTAAPSLLLTTGEGYRLCTTAVC
jgi:DNA-binding response OmpR family regulator